MMTTLDVTADATFTDFAALDEAWDGAVGDVAETPEYRVSDGFFGSESECAADALFVKRLSLIVVPTVLVLCLLTLVLALAA